MPGLALHMQSKYTPRPDRETRLGSAVRIATWAVCAGDLYPAHRSELLSMAIWKATELDGKWNTGFRSAALAHTALGTKVNHEHVVSRRWLTAAMVAWPAAVEDLLRLAIGCVVTASEHRLLDSCGPRQFGWERYLAARIDVMDWATGSLVDLEAAAREQGAILGRYGPLH